MKIIFSLILISVLLPFFGKAQGTFNFSDTVFTLGQRHRLALRYALSEGRVIVDSTSILQLDSVIQFLNKNRQVIVEIGVHTDSRGADSSNLKMTQWRSEQVRNYLVKQGVPESQMTAKGYGETQLIIPEEEINKYKKTNKLQYEKLHQMNRRTELKIIRME
ncbi:OmpA family protein [Fluviicola taffensis]|uniref:OmpA family protein n=1 Tax=Fluviicola taffensis TaxID=191579 RepID=UPI00313816D4